MILRRLTEALCRQDWSTFAVEIMIVILGVFIGIQVANWNDARVDQGRAVAYLERVGQDLDAELASLVDRKGFWDQVSRHGETGLRYAQTGTASDTSHWPVLLAYYQAREPLNKSARSALMTSVVSARSISRLDSLQRFELLVRGASACRT